MKEAPQEPGFDDDINQGMADDDRRQAPLADNAGPTNGMSSTFGRWLMEYRVQPASRDQGYEARALACKPNSSTL